MLREAKRGRMLFAALAVCVVAALAATLAAPNAAWARDVRFSNGGTATLHDDGTITGTCSTVVYFVPFSNDDVEHFDVHMPDGQVLRGECIDYGFPTPMDDQYAFTATPTGGGAYSVIVESGYADWVVHTDGSIEQGWPDRSQRVGHVVWTPLAEVKGGVSVVKRSRHLSADGAAGDGSLAGAAFEVANSSGGPVTVNGVEYANGEVVLTITTNAEGVAASADRVLPAGSYTVRETRTTERGYLLDAVSQAWSASFSIDEDGQRVTIGDAAGGDAAGGVSNDEIRGNVELLKVDADTKAASPQGDSSLAGAVYEIVNRSAAPVPSPQTGADIAPGEVVCSITTDSSGRASTTASSTNGWAMPADFNGKALAYGTYEIREAGAPEGYLADEAWSATFAVRGDGQVLSISASDAVSRGRLVVGKVSRENGGYLPQGAATLEGWTFEVVNRSAHPVVVDGATFRPGEVVKTIETRLVGGAFVADTGERCLPYGTYEVHEVQTTLPRENGYLFDGQSQAWSQTFEVRADGQVVDFTGAGACSNQVVRGDLELVKAKSPDMTRLAGVPFKITSKTTGEWHVIVADRNGQASTSADMASHAAGTNANDRALREDGTVDESLLSDEAGVWFDGRVDAPSVPNDAFGALPFDSYVVEELRVGANEGLDLLTIETTVYRDGVIIDLGTLFDNEIPTPRIWTSLYGEEGAKVVVARAGAVVVDTVSFDNLVPSRPYLLHGELWLIDEGRAVELLSTAEETFEPRSMSGTNEMAFEFDASALQGRSLVCFERVLDADGNELASHADVEDEGQTVYVPAIATTLTDAETGEHTASCAETGDVTLTDTVAYAGLAPNRPYSLTGTLYDKETGEPVILPDGSPVTATRSFVPRESEGSIEVTFSLAGAGVAGKSLVAFESLACEGVEYAVHADIDDEGQTVSVPPAPPTPPVEHVPAVRTTMLDTKTETHVAPSATACSLVDTVAYEGLEPGRAYTVEGTLYDKETGEPIKTKTAGGDEPEATLTSQVSFAPEEPAGFVTVTFQAETDLGGKSLVAFERVLDEEGNVVVAHEDIDNADQTVRFPTPPAPPEEEKTPTKAIAQAIAKTGDAIGWALLAFIGAAALGLALASLSVRKLRREDEVRGKHMAK